MPAKIDIEFFEPGKEQDKKEGILILYLSGKNVLEIKGSMMDMLKEFNILYATGIHTDTIYSLVGCYFSGLKDGYSSFIINEVYKDAFLKQVQAPCFIETDFEMTGLTAWINHTRITFKPSFKDAIATATLKKPKTIVWQISPTFSLEIMQVGSYEFEAGSVAFKDVSKARLLSTEPLSRLELYNATTSLTRLFMLFSHQLPKLSRLWYTGTDNRTIALLNFFKKPAETEISITLRDIENNFEEMLQTFFRSNDHYTEVLDLIQEALQNKTVEISFLNLTTAMEICHKYFLEKDLSNPRSSLANELIQKGTIKETNGKWENILRYYHILKLSATMKFIQVNIPDLASFASRLRTSRNYYTHYGEKKKQVYSANRLLWVNRTLVLLLKGILLQLLGAPEEAINKMQMNHSGIFFTKYEDNQFSVLYTGSVISPKSEEES